MLTNTFLRAASLLPLTLLAASMAMAVEQPTTDAGSPENTKVLPGVEVHAHADTRRDIHFPATQATIPAKRVQVTINAVDVEDAVKYLPSVFLRKRNYGDTQAVLATRTWGVNSSARTLVYIDDIPISALVVNNNTLGAPRWGITSPEVIDHIDMLYG
ncbi:MAG TPA: Plug domain-containing protein, partial [Rhodanobacter sp.]